MPNRPFLVAAVACCGALLSASPARAVDDLLTPRSIAMGDSLRADASGALGPLLNPAGMTLRRSYTLEAMYGFNVQDMGHHLLASIVDSVTSRVSAGVYYSFVHTNPKFAVDGLGPVAATREGNETGLALALPLGNWFAFGITSKYLKYTTDAPNPRFVDAKATPDVPPKLVFDSSTNGATADGFTMDAGISLRLGDSFAAAVTGQNLIPLRSIEAPMSLGTGLAYHYGTQLTLAADFVVNFNKYKSPAPDVHDLVTYKLGGGLEWLIAGKVALRAGASWDSGRPGTFVSMGLAYVHQSFAIDLSYRQEVQHGVDSYIVAGLRVFLQ